MENLVGTKMRKAMIESLQLQCVDHAAYSVNNASKQQPEKGGSGEVGDNLRHGENAEPSHGDIDHRGHPLRTGNPAKFK